MDSWNYLDCNIQQFLSENDLGDDCIVQQFITTQIEGSCKTKYSPVAYTDQEFSTFNVYQDITKKNYEEHSLSELQSSVSKMLRCAKYHIEHKLESLDSSLETKEACESRFKSCFYSLNDCCLNRPYKCLLFNPIIGTSWEGECFLCNEYYCFAINHISEADAYYAPLKISIPYLDITAITKAGRKYHHDRVNGKKPGSISECTIIPLNECLVKPSVLQIWTSDKKVHQFFGFGGHFDQVYTSARECWDSIKITDDST
jgi:hypothetical protein